MEYEPAYLAALLALHSSDLTQQCAIWACVPCDATTAQISSTTILDSFV